MLPIDDEYPEPFSPDFSMTVARRYYGIGVVYSVKVSVRPDFAR